MLKLFPRILFGGASTSGHQVEGNNINADLWYLENLEGTVFVDRSGKAMNGFELWEEDLDLASEIGLNTYRFSLEWARIEPKEGEFSQEALEHYKNVIIGCKNRGMKVILTYNHFTAPFWFSADGGWTNPTAPKRFAKFCAVATENYGDLVDYVITFNEPQILPLIGRLGIPDFVFEKKDKMLANAEKLLGIEKFSALNVSRQSDVKYMQPILLEGHLAAKTAIKSIKPDLPVGVSIAIFDDQEGETGSIIEEVREELYGPWLNLAQDDDFLGIQNYERKVWGKSGSMKVDEGYPVAENGKEAYFPSLANSVRFGYEKTKVPILVTEHGINTQNDSLRAEFIEKSLIHLHDVISEGIPVLGYCHWSLMDNFEWIFGYGPKMGLIGVDRSTFKRTIKPSAHVYGKIAKSNRLKVSS